MRFVANQLPHQVEKWIPTKNTRDENLLINWLKMSRQEEHSVKCIYSNVSAYHENIDRNKPENIQQFFANYFQVFGCRFSAQHNTSPRSCYWCGWFGELLVGVLGTVHCNLLLLLPLLAVCVFFLPHREICHFFHCLSSFTSCFLFFFCFYFYFRFQFGLVWFQWIASPF